MEKLTVYGLPITPRPLLAELAGASFCVSYATRKDLGPQLDQAIELVGRNGILLVDNGAFTMHKKGVSSRSDEYLEDFAEWANEILARCPQAVAVAPDVIGGTVEENAQLFAEFRMLCDFDDDRLMPVWHMHESLDYLIYLCESAGYVAFGSSGEFWQVGSQAWHGRIREAFAAIEAWEQSTGEVRPRLHMMRAQSMAHLYPFDSSDSTNVAVNHTRYKKQGAGHVSRFAARIDGKIQASAGAAAEHQIKRPLLEHVATENLKAIWLLEAAGYQVREPLELDAGAWLAQYHAAAA